MNDSNPFQNLEIVLGNQSFKPTQISLSQLIKSTPPQAVPDLTNLRDACMRNEKDQVQMIIKQCPDLINEVVDNRFDWTLLMKACFEGWDEIVEDLVLNHSNQIEINKQSIYDGFTALYHAVYNGRVNCVRSLLSHPILNVNILCGMWFNKTVLWYCKDNECYNLLLPYFPTMGEQEKKMAWMWSMYYSFRIGAREVKEIIKQFSPSILSQMSDDLSSLLYLAVPRRDGELVKYLLESHGDIININIQDKDGETPLYRAVGTGFVENVKSLLSHPNINVNIQCKNGRTALHQALFLNEVDCFNILLSCPDIDVAIRDKEGKTASEMEVRGSQDPSIKTKLKMISLLPHQKLVKWNRSKIMLVGQGRAGKTALANNLAGRWLGETPSTIGAEQMDMKLLYGGVKGGRLEEYERPEQELEALLAELSYYDSDRPTINQISKEETWRNSISHREVGKDTSQSANSKLSSAEKGETLFPYPITLHDIKIDEVDLHYRNLQELETASNYKLILVDFGGQSLFNVLHGFFMSKYGIYLVVFDMELFLSNDTAEQDICRKELKFWLNSIMMHTSDIGTVQTAPVAIVGTRADKVCKKEDHQMISLELEEMFGDMAMWESLMWCGSLCFFPNNNTLTEDNAVSQELLRSIEQNLGEAAYMKREIPILWIKIFDEMKALHNCYVSYHEAVKIAEQKLKDGVSEAIDEGEQPGEMNDVQKMRIEMEVREMLRFLGGMGMLMWIAEKGLGDIIILDPIEYLVKPATTIICKHLATKDDPYKTKHERPEIHGESKKVYGGDWMRMLEYGEVSEVLAKDLLSRYYKFVGAINFIHDVDKILWFMMRFGLIVPLFSSSKSIASSERSNNENRYFVPSLLPSSPFLLDDNIQDRNIKKLIGRLRLRSKKLDETWSIGMRYSLFCFLPREDLSATKSFGGGYDIISSSELSQQGFLPHSLFERFICRYIQFICDHEDKVMERSLLENEIMTGFQGKVQLTYQHHSIRILEKREENRIEVVIQTHDADSLSSADKEMEKEIFLEIYERSLEMMELSLRECYEGLQVKTLLHLSRISSLTSNGSNEEGFVTLRKVRALLSTSDAFQDSKHHHLNSYDAKCETTLIAGEMKKDPYWSVWKEKVKIPVLSSGFASCSSAPPPLAEMKKTHVFLSHDWGIDGHNHNRVKEVSEALKNRGLVTWIDDEKILTEIDEKIVDGIDHTECMLVFITENYVKKVNGGNDKDYCKREFKYAFEKLGCQRMIAVVLDESMKDKAKWGGLISFNLGPTLYFDLSMIFESFSCQSEESIKTVMDRLYEKIIITITSLGNL